ncbi:cupin domain-containing protein [Methylobacter marinus]|uniref:cupin domain-containing protein n=1 Tax=Methylobacter marinus TaxID=34058 RepID=UPI00036E13B9|nr:cupin domain-containing protein [Methylobacter marinus]
METVWRFKPETEFYTDEKCFIVEMLNTPDDEACSIARARVEPGITTCLHAVLGTVERYVILEGEGEVEIDGAPCVPVGPADVVSIPAGRSQRIKNTGTTSLVFLAICTPRFRPESYVDLETSA